MNIMTTMDLQAALIAHLNWKSKLSDFFYGVEDLKASDVSDHTSCDFGRWLYSNGLKELAHFPETDTLEKLHENVHDSIKELVAMPKDMRMGTAGQEVLNRFRKECDQLVELLEHLEKKVAEQARG
jgi:hypothetical protein